MLQHILENITETIFGDFIPRAASNLTTGNNFAIYSIHQEESLLAIKCFQNFFKTYNSTANVLAISNPKYTLSTIHNNFKELLITNKIPDQSIQIFIKKKKLIILAYFPSNYNQNQILDFYKSLTRVNRTNISFMLCGNYSILSNKNDFEKVYETLIPNFVELPRINHSYTEKFISSINVFYKKSINLPDSKKIFFLSGGLVTLTFHICFEVIKNGREILYDPQKLCKTGSVSNYLMEIDTAVSKLSFDKLLKLRILNENGTLFTPLLNYSLKQYKNDTLKVLYPLLTKTDRIILGVFVQNPNEPVSKEQIGLYLNREINGSADWAIYKSVERMKKKLKGKIMIKTVKGQGWMLVTH